jgi:hypothetical protein
MGWPYDTNTLHRPANRGPVTAVEISVEIVQSDQWHRSALSGTGAGVGSYHDALSLHGR